MNKFAVIIVILLAVLCCCCFFTGGTLVYVLNNKPTPISSTEIPNDFEVTLERGACFGFCPIYSVTIYKDGSVRFNGERFVESTGISDYSISINKVKEIYIEIQNVNFFGLRDKYENQNISDLPSSEITVKANGITKSIYMYGLQNDIPASLTNLAEKIDEIAETEDLIGQPTIND